MTATTLRSVSVTKRDGSTRTVETPYTDSEALERLTAVQRQQNRPGFAASLIAQARRYPLSERQMAWVHVLVADLGTERGPAALLPRTRAMLDKAAESLRYPKVNFTTENGQRVRLARAGQRSRTPGTINITNGKPYGNNIWFGKIDLDGSLHTSGSMTPDVLAFLKEFEAAPVSVATAYGIRTGECCFCARPLADSRSVAVGYGPVCAGKYGLPWGDERIPSTLTVSTSNDSQGSDLADLEEVYTDLRSKGD